MRDEHKTICSPAAFELIAPDAAPVPVKVELSYSSRDPYAVQASFRTGHDSTVDWVFARDLLADGLVDSAGTGDVRVQPMPRPDADGAGAHLALRPRAVHHLRAVAGGLPGPHLRGRSADERVLLARLRRRPVRPSGHHRPGLIRRRRAEMTIFAGEGTPDGEQGGRLQAPGAATLEFSHRTGDERSPESGAHADVAQLVAHHLAKVRVAGSSPVVRSEEIGPEPDLPVHGDPAEWPSGLGKGLQSPVRGFDSRLRLARLAQRESTTLTR